MTNKNARLYLPLVHAMMDGKTIQFKGPLGWRDYENPAFDAQPEDYRIKPEPREWFLCMCPDGSSRAYDIEQKQLYPGTRQIRVREILD